LPFQEKEKTILIYEALPDAGRLDQVTMNLYEKTIFDEEILKAYKSNKKYTDILHSCSYRFGRVLTWLPRKIRDYLRKKQK